MVQAVVYLEDGVNRVLNIIKAKYGLKDKSEAISVAVQEYEQHFLEPELRPSYIQKIQDIEKKGKFTNYKTLGALRKEIEHA